MANLLIIDDDIDSADAPAVLQDLMRWVDDGLLFRLPDAAARG